MRRTTFLNCIQFAEFLILRLLNCEMADRVVEPDRLNYNSKIPKSTDQRFRAIYNRRLKRCETVGRGVTWFVSVHAQHAALLCSFIISLRASKLVLPGALNVIEKYGK